MSTIKIHTNAAIPGAPEGVLGDFIQSKIAEYVEPERAGTPKGEPVGLSRKKYHAALLGLTNLSVSKQAKHAGVSYGVLRKWRTEEAFLDCILRLMDEFIDGPFDEAAHAWLGLLIVPSHVSLVAGPNLDAESFATQQALVGFGDTALYSSSLVRWLLFRWHHDVAAAVKAGKDFYPVLAWVRPLDRLLRQEIDDSEVHRNRRQFVAQLAKLQREVLAAYPIEEHHRDVVDSIAQLIIALND